MKNIFILSLLSLCAFEIACSQADQREWRGKVKCYSNNREFYISLPANKDGNVNFREHAGVIASALDLDPCQTIKFVIGEKEFFGVMEYSNAMHIKAVAVTGTPLNEEQIAVKIKIEQLRANILAVEAARTAEATRTPNRISRFLNSILGRQS
jgi:hypothetical protein